MLTGVDGNDLRLTIYTDAIARANSMLLRQAVGSLKKAGLLDFELIPFGSYAFWENLFAPEHQAK